MSGPSERAIEAAMDPCPCRWRDGKMEAGPAGATYTVPCTHGGVRQAAERHLRRAHSPELGEDRSVSLRAVLDVLRDRDARIFCGNPKPRDHDSTIAFLAREFGGGEHGE